MIQSLLDYLSSLSLRKLLLLLTLLLALPAVGLIVHFGLDQHHDALQEGVAETRKLAHSIASEQRNLTAAAHQLVTVLGQLPQVREHKTAAVNGILTSVLALNPQYANIVIADPTTGDVWASALPLTKPFSLRDKRTFRNAVKTRQFSSGEYVIGQISTKPTIGFGYPVLDEKGEVKAVIAVNFNFDHYNVLFNQAGLPQGTTFNIIDYNGVIIDRNLNPEGFVGKKANDGIFMSMVNGPEENSFIDVGVSGDRRIISYTKLRLRNETFPYLYVRAGIPLQATLSKAAEKQFYNMAFLSLFLLAAIFLALFIGKHCFVNRITALQEASHRLAAGNLHTRVSACLQGGELGDLAQTFDQMADQLSVREKAVRESEARFRSALENAPIGMALVSLNGAFLLVNRALCAILGYEKEALQGLTFAEVTHPDDLNLDIPNVERLLDGEVSAYTVEKRYITKGRELVWGQLTASVLKGDEGDPEYFIVQIEDISDRKRVEKEREGLIGDLQGALCDVRILSGLLPICDSCKKIRDDKGYWNQLETYISKHSGAMFSYGICPDCEARLQGRRET
ncbi:PAS domain S-box protein [Oryzomonas japonica]|uniref:PAS domain S-box protein n=1 Tax=Oryzomonas japonica TaxID=2603858 RepID=A0A7J4ZTA3_9BACT|nr:PAS domain S-box protein [Oryzomonas japonica]KAB0666573.1 PAS domain S-box protein [Oryzomonas japonica]